MSKFHGKTLFLHLSLKLLNAPSSFLGLRHYSNDS